MQAHMQELITPDFPCNCCKKTHDSYNNWKLYLFKYKILILFAQLPSLDFKF